MNALSRRDSRRQQWRQCRVVSAADVWRPTLRSHQQRELVRAGSRTSKTPDGGGACVAALAQSHEAAGGEEPEAEFDLSESGNGKTLSDGRSVKLMVMAETQKVGGVTV